jgi:hypothetical protein
MSLLKKYLPAVALRQILRGLSVYFSLALLAVAWSVRCETSKSPALPSTDGVQPQNSYENPALQEPAVSKFLRDESNDASILDDPFLGKARVTLNRRSGTLEFNLAALPSGAILSEDNVLSPLLEAAIRRRVLRRDISRAFPSDKSWEPLFDAVNRAIDSCLRATVKSTSRDSLVTSTTACSTIDDAFDKFASKLRENAKLQKLDVVESRGATSFFRVKVTFNPKKVRLRIMTALQYRECLFFHLHEDDFFNDVLQEEENLIGRYRYRAEWPAELGGPEEGDFEIKGPATLTFTPDGR